MSLEMNKIAASVLTAGVVAMGASFVGEVLIHPHVPEDPHYTVGVDKTKSAEKEKQEPKGPEPILPLLADADPSAGKNAARACAACHSFEKGGPNKVGPALYDIMGAKIAAVDGFSYSSALKGKEGEWTYQKMNAWLYDPQGWAQGTKMSYGGVKDAQERADIIAYLRSMADEKMPLPTEEEIEKVTGGGDEGKDSGSGDGEAKTEAEDSGADAGDSGGSGESDADA
ncbi:cytochrome c [Limimonas halophila]|uniref:Cytochrome c n=1 Tax=Limimonas halophila TaxID=1082479 RepID=A0A1G7U8Y1_9PROT|nr:c-type cytochrome [Limimonas halophila]SDG44075.1 cytochrome c [Limimonas halophila]